MACTTSNHGMRYPMPWHALYYIWMILRGDSSGIGGGNGSVVALCEMSAAQATQAWPTD